MNIYANDNISHAVYYSVAIKLYIQSINNLITFNKFKKLFKFPFFNYSLKLMLWKHK